MPTLVEPKAAENYWCTICLDLFKNATQVGTCGHIFCSHCLKKYAADQTRFLCPVCRHQCHATFMVSVKFIDRQIKSLMVKCPNHQITADREHLVHRHFSKKEAKVVEHHSNTHSAFMIGMKRKRSFDDDEMDHTTDSNGTSTAESTISVTQPPSKKRKVDAVDSNINIESNDNGDGMLCKWTGELRSLDDHIASCPMQVISCKHCSKEVIRNQLDRHYGECRKYPMQCSKCGHINITRDCMEYHAKHQCPMSLIDCLHCLEKIKRKDRSKHHKTTCPETRISCTFKPIGCDAMVKRKHIDDHNEQNTVAHLSIVMNLVMEQQQTIRNLNERIRNLERGATTPESDGSDEEESESDHS